MSESGKAQDYTIAILMDKPPKQVYDAVNNMRGWWSGEITGSTDRLGAEWTYRYQDLHRSPQKITEIVPGKNVVWHVTDRYVSYVKDKTEWNGTNIVCDIAKQGDKTEHRFTHVGLAPAIDCYRDCSDAWRFPIRDSLRKQFTTGKDAPNSPE